MDKPNKIRKAIVQVKSGSVSVNHIRDLAGVIQREESAIGVFITLEEPAKPMRTEAVLRSIYSSPLGKNHPGIQILTVDEILAGNEPDMPPWIAPVAKPALKTKAAKTQKFI